MRLHARGARGGERPGGAAAHLGRGIAQRARDPLARRALGPARPGAQRGTAHARIVRFERPLDRAGGNAIGRHRGEPLERGSA